jgi:4-amino-4-deoxy-L-arabinose transferase-like glycosyltransferase
MILMVKGRRAWLAVAAAVAGAACGTKYPGGILLVPLIVLAADVGASEGGTRKALGYAVGVLVIFASAFLITTPGAIVERSKFIADVLYEVRHYRTGHLGYTVSPGPMHAGLMIEYLALVAFSRFPFIAVIPFSFALVGAFDTARRDRRVAWLLVWMPLLYFLFMSTQRVMFVRNLLILFPPFAILAARGVTRTAGWWQPRWIRGGLPAVVGLCILVNTGWLVYASFTVRNRASIDPTADVLRYLRHHPTDRVFLSATLRSRLRNGGAASPTNTVPGRKEATKLLINSCDGFEQRQWPANRFRQWEMVAGPYEVNFDYYPTWGGNCHIVAIGAHDARRLPPIR